MLVHKPIAARGPGTYPKISGDLERTQSPSRTSSSILHRNRAVCPPNRKKRGNDTHDIGPIRRLRSRTKPTPTGNLNDLDKSGNHFLTTCSGQQESIHCLPAECGCSNLLLHISNSSHLWSCTQTQPHYNNNNRERRVSYCPATMKRCVKVKVSRSLSPIVHTKVLHTESAPRAVPG